jgi:hypothetical protein
MVGSRHRIFTRFWRKQAGYFSQSPWPHTGLLNKSAALGSTFLAPIAAQPSHTASRYALI